MSVLRPHKNIAARMGRWSASHRKLAIFGWLAFVLSAIVVGTAVGQKTIDQQNNDVGQANRADHILKQAGFTESGPLTEFVVIQNHKLTIHDPAFQAAVRDVVSAVSPYKAGFHNLRSPLAAANHDQVTHDGRTALVEFDMNGTLKSAENRIDPVTSAVASVGKSHPRFYVGEAGAASSDKALTEMFNKQLGQAGTRSVPLTLLILVLVFGSLVAACVPMMLGLPSVVAHDRADRRSSATSRRWTGAISAVVIARRARRRRRLLAVLPPP